MPERAVFVTEIDALPEGLEGFDRLYYGHETCPWRLPDRRELKRAREEAARLGMSFTLVTPTLDEHALDMVSALIDDLDGDEGAEIVVNDVGLLEELSRRGRRGTVVVGRLLTRQRRGAGWRGSLPAEDEAAGYLMGSSLESPRLVEWFRSRYGIRRFEIDDLLQGVRVGPLPGDVRLSVYSPYVVLTVTRLCPWTFDGRRWRRSEGCSAPCRGSRLVLEAEEGGAPIHMGGCAQFLKREDGEIFSAPAVDRVVIQPRIPA